MVEVNCMQNSWPSHQDSPALLPDVSAGYWDTAVVDESGMIRTQMGMHNRSEMVTLLGTPCLIPPQNRNSNNNSSSILMSIILLQVYT
jgi:hypothetical protein